MGKRRRVSVVVPSVVKRDMPHVVRGEFSQDSLVVRPVVSPEGPRVECFRCVGSWDVLVEDGPVESFLELSECLGNVVRLYHGTLGRNIESIASAGLRLGRSGCMFGRGIYFGSPAKALGYTGRGDAHYILEAEVVLGRVYEAVCAERLSRGVLLERGFDSVHGRRGFTRSWGGRLVRDEWVVYDRAQVLLHRVHEYHRAVPRVDPEEYPSGRCQVMVPGGVVLHPVQRSFRELIEAPRECGVSSFTRVQVTGGSEVWVCKGCVGRLDLHVGMQFEVKLGARVRRVRVRG